MQSFYRLTFFTLIAVYLLILVGGIVRSTGSGMGCPDWPKCFGSYVPPTSAEQLPSNYKEIYSNFRQQKNERFANYLYMFGFTETADKLLSDKAVQQEADFNALKTWIEYINRIIGVIIGLLIFTVLVASVRFFKTNTKLTVLAILSFLLVVFQGWIGSFVVSTNLTPWTITVHMFLALLLVALLVYLLFVTERLLVGERAEKTISIAPWITTLVIVCLVMLLVQTLFGTQVREAVDRVSMSGMQRNTWIDSLGTAFIVHRSFSWMVLGVHAFLVFKLWKMGLQNGFVRATILLILGTIFTGVGMAWFSVPPVLQPLHLLLASVTFGVEFFLFLKVSSLKKAVLMKEYVG
jgi:heme a synthase